MRSFRSMKYQIAAAAALLLSGLYVAAAAAPADQAQWSEFIPIDEKRNPGERIVVLLHFWATWSPESIEQLAHYDELYKKHKDQDLVVIAIHNSQGADDLDDFIAERGYTLPIAVDAGASAQRYGIWSWPQSVLIDLDCRLAWLSQEGEAPSPAQLKYLLDDIDAFPTH